MQTENKTAVQQSNTGTGNTTTPVKQASLFDVDSFLGPELAQVFGSKPTKGKDANGNEIQNGITLALAPMKEIKHALNLTRKDQKDELAEEILLRQDEAFGKVKSYVSGLSSDWTLVRFTAKKLSNGQNQITVVSREIPRKKLVSYQKIADSYGIPIEDVEAFIKAQQDKVKNQTTMNVDSKVVA